MTVGQAAIFVGLIETTMINYISPSIDSAPATIPHGWTMVWDGIIVSCSLHTLNSTNLQVNVL